MPLEESGKGEAPAAEEMPRPARAVLKEDENNGDKDNGVDKPAKRVPVTFAELSKQKGGVSMPTLANLVKREGEEPARLTRKEGKMASLIQKKAGQSP